METDCKKCQIVEDLFIMLCPLHGAAPDLLEAAKATMARLGDYDGGPIDAIRSMLEKEIAKAEGAQP